MVTRLLLVAAAAAVLAAQDIAIVRDVEITLTEGTSMAAAASPDRRWIAIDLVGGIWIVPMRGGDARRITPDTIEARQPTWSPDSESIAFQGYDIDGAWHIYVVPRSGGDPVPLTTGEFDDREPAWSHDGSRIAFSSDRYGGISTIWELTLATGRVRRLTERSSAMPFWSPTDQEVAFIARDGGRVGRPSAGIWAVGSDGAERLIVVPERGRGGDALPMAAAWSTDGTQIAYTSARGSLFLGNRQVSRPDEDVFPFRPQWVSRTDVVYTADGKIRRRSAVAETTTIPFTAKVMLHRASYAIARRVLENGEPQPLRGIVTPTVSPNGRMVAFTALGDLWILPLGSAPVRITNDAAVDLDPAWSPDSTRIAYASDRGGHMDIWIHEVGSGRDTQLTHERGAASAPAWSPDASQIAYLVDRRSAKTARLAAGTCLGGEAPPPTANEIGRPTWVPGCKAIAVSALFPYSDRYREGLNQLLLYGFDVHAWSQALVFPQHNVGNRQDTGPVWSPDGSLLAFVTEGRLWTVPVDGRASPLGVPRDVAADQPQSPSWEGDSRHVVFQTPAGLRRVIPEGGVPEVIPLDLRWQPKAPPSRVVVHAGHVLDGTMEGLRTASDIVVERGVIRTVEPHRDELHVGDVVDAGEEFIVPGLIDMRARVDAGYGGNFGRIWLAYGVTSVRIPAVSAYSGLELRESIDAGRRPGPRVFVAGDPLDGVRSDEAGGVAVSSEAQLDQELERASALGIDFFSIGVRLPGRLRQRVVDYAHAHDRPATSDELYPAVAFAIDSVEHLKGPGRAGDVARQSARRRVYRDVVDLIARSGATLTPALGADGAFRARITGDRTLLYDRRLALFPLPLIASLSDAANARADPSLDAAIRSYEADLKTIAAAGARIVAGSDAPDVPYGLGLHVELESYVRAGLSPFQALQTATINAAQALGVGDELGTIEVGKIADLTFLGGDPLADIRNTRDVKRVMKGGRVYTVTDLVSGKK